MSKSGKTVELSVSCSECGETVPIEVPRPASALAVKVLRQISKNYQCNACRTAQEEANREAAAREAAERQAEELRTVRASSDETLRACGVGVRLCEASFVGCPDLPPELVFEAQAWAANPRGIVLLHGIPGSAKSWLAVAMLRDILVSGTLRPGECRHVCEREYLGKLKESYGEKLRERPTRLLGPSHPKRVPLLVFDDLGFSRSTDWAREEVSGLIEARHADDLLTIITSNFGPDRIAEHIDPRLTSRIVESGRVWKFPAKDLRVHGSLGRTE